MPLVVLGQQNSELVIGINGGGHIANKKTSVQYNGFYNSYGVTNIFNRPENRTIFDQFFQYPYSIETSLNAIKYSPGTEIGFHIGKQKRKSKIYVDINFADLKVQDVVTIAVDDPNNQSVDPTYIPISLIGKEKRNMINLGVIKTVYEESNFSLLNPIFIQVLEVRLKENYIIVDNKQYNIIHNSGTLLNQNLGNSPGGYGFGIGSGLVFNYFMNKDLSFDFGYHIQFSKTNFSENLSPWGIQHSLFARIVMNGSKYFSSNNE